MRTYFIASLVCVGAIAPVHAQLSNAERKAAVKFVQSLQTSTGGFLSMSPRPEIRLAPTLRASSSAVRALHYLGADLTDKKTCSAFVERCFDSASGGFSDMPGGKADVFTTAVGLMAVTELKMPTGKYADPAIKFFEDNVKSFEDVRIAVAGLERLGKKSAKSDAWAEIAAKVEVPKVARDGGARDMASRLVTMLRLGAKVDLTREDLAFLREGQMPEGGWRKDASKSDLETTYRVMRCFMMFGEKPAKAADVHAFIKLCANTDGGFGLSPGEGSTVSATYFAAIVDYWLRGKK